MLSPQHSTAPLDVVAHVEYNPPATVTASLMPTTSTGVDERVSVPSPSSPWLLAPQHFTVPADVMTHEWKAPDAMVIPSVMPPISTGVDDRSAVVPLPS